MSTGTPFGMAASRGSEFNFWWIAWSVTSAVGGEAHIRDALGLGAPICEKRPMTHGHTEEATPEATPDPWAEAAGTWDEDPGVRTYADAAWASLVAAVPLPPHIRVLDFGCGTGLLSERLAPRVASIVAVDASAPMVAVLEAKSLPNVRSLAIATGPEALSGDALGPEPFDLIVCSSVCAFLDDYPATVAQLARRLAPGGYFVQWDWEWDAAADEPFGLTAEGIAQALGGAGLEVISVATGFDVPFEDQRMRPLMGIGRRPAA